MMKKVSDLADGLNGLFPLNAEALGLISGGDCGYVAFASDIVVEG